MKSKAIKGPLANAFSGQNGIADFERDVPACRLTGRTDDTVTTGYIRPVEPVGFEITLGTLTGFAKPTLVKRDLMKLARQVVRHEVAHARFTDFTACAAWVAEGGVFKLLNLFEDCRIEHAERKRLRHAVFGAGRYARTGFNWHWHKLTDPKATKVTATGAILNIKHNWLVSAIDGPNVGAVTGKGAWDLACEYYSKACKAKTTRELFPLMREWVREFPYATTDPIGEGIGETLAPGRERGGKPSEDSESIGGGDCTPDTPKTTGGEGGGKSVCPGFDTTGSLDAPTADRLRGLAETLVTQTDSVADSIGACGSRLHLPGILNGEPSFRRAGGLGAPRLTLVCDMSGSMARVWGHDGLREVAVALATARGLSTEVWISGGRNAVRVTPDQLSRVLPTHGSESIGLAFRNIAEVNGFGELTVVLTDGQIGDGEVDAAKYRSLGCQCIGATIGAVCDLPRFVRQFGRVCLRETPAELIRAIVYEARQIAANAAR